MFILSDVLATCQESNLENENANLDKGLLSEAPETVRGKGGWLTPEGHEGWSSLGIRGGHDSKHSKYTNYDTAVTAICDRYKCTYSDVDIKCSSITDNQSLKLSTVYFSLFVDFHKLLGHLFRRHLGYSSFVYHTVLMQMQIMNCLAEKGISLPPCAPVQGQRGHLPPWFRRPCLLY